MTPKDFKRTRDTVKTIENLNRSRLIEPKRRRNRQVFQPGGSTVPAKSPSGGVALGSISSPTSFTATLLIPSSGGPALTTGSTVTAYNMYGTAIPASKLIWLTFALGYYYLVQSDCP